MKKITIKDLTPTAQKIVVTHKVGDLSVRQYIKQQGVFDKVVSMLIDGDTVEQIREVLEDDLFDYLGQPSQSDVHFEYYPTISREIMELIQDDAEAEAEDQNKRAKEYYKEKRDAYNSAVGGTF